jgi:serine/threonine-protein kinase
MNDGWRRPSVGLGVILFVAAVAGYWSTCVLYPTRLAPDREEVPALRGLDQIEAMARLTAQSLRGRVVDTVSDGEAPSGSVAWQSPAPGTVRPQGALVRVALSSGPPPIAVPDLEGFDLPLATSVLRAAGLALGPLDTVPSAAEVGIVVGTMPAGGTAARLGQPVAISVSRGTPSILVPDVVGLTLDGARDRLAAVALTVGTLTQRLEGAPGTVVAQTPLAGTLVIKGQPIALSVSGAMQ